MDELEISGKRYISTRRAAKEYKYHSDYIGQLIRGKKLLGRKVGRSWYVELDSLAAYFKQEGIEVAQAPLVARTVVQKVAEPIQMAEAPVAAPVQKIYVAPVSNYPEPRNITPMVEEKNIEIAESVRESIHIPVRVRRPSFETQAVAKKVSPLTYVSDDEPYIPMTRRSSYTSLSTATVMPRSEEEVQEYYEQEVEEAPQYIAPAVTVKKTAKRNFFMPAISIVALGVVALAIVAGSSIFVSSHTVIEAGKSASVGYSIK